MEFSIVIASYNRREYIIDALESLRLQTLDKGLFEVIVVDNNSQDDTEARCKEYMERHPEMNTRYLSEHRQGASFARNSGAALARGEFLVFMDDDAVAAPDYLEKARAFFQSHPQAGGLGGRIIPRYIPSEPHWMSHYVSSMVGNFDYSPIIVEFSTNRYPLESNMMVRKGDFERVGGLNTNLPGVKGTLRIGGEGKEFFFKLKALGRAIWYDPHVQVEHVVEVSRLTREYLYRVASGYGRGERVRTMAIGQGAYYNKIIEYSVKLGAALVLAAGYAMIGKPARSMPLIRFRIDALKGLLEKPT